MCVFVFIRVASALFFGGLVGFVIAWKLLAVSDDKMVT
jgi:hypothetical protein